MEQANDQWLWFVDNELIDALAQHDTLESQRQKRPVQSSALAKALNIKMEGKTEQARREIRAAIEGGASLPELDWTKAHLEFQLGQYEEALQDYRKVLEAFPKHKAAAYNSGLCLEKLERFEEAATAFGTTAGLDANLVDAGIGLGVCHLHLNRPEKALAAFDSCLKAKPNYDKALYGKAVALQVLGRAHEAMQLCLKLIPANGSNADFLTNVIGLTLARGDDAKTREYCERLLRVCPAPRPAF